VNLSISSCIPDDPGIARGRRHPELRPATIQIGGSLYQVIYPGSEQKGRHVNALLRDAHGDQGKAIFLSDNESARATIYLNDGGSFLYTMTATGTNLCRWLNRRPIILSTGTLAHPQQEKG